ncbi:MAG: hypothetical protein IKA72_01975 [Clostridia bacterium]|nr:hypothetical protein [Clostridia bacterium]
MDLNKNNSVLNEFNLPPEDYDSTGQVRVLRKRMLKKLLKHELKSLLPTTWIMLAVLASLTVLMVVSMDSYMAEAQLTPFLTVCLVLYIYALVAVMVTPLIIASTRYNKNFFKGEGYLTFSMPASVEEHLFAKHVSALVAFFLSSIVALVCVAVVIGAVVYAGGTDTGIIEEPVFEGITPLTVIEALIRMILIPISIVCGVGAIECWAQKFKKTRQIVFRVVIAYCLIIAFETLLILLEEKGVFAFFYTPVGSHVAVWLEIFMLIGVIVFSLWYEIRRLKKKLDLK